MFRNETSQTCTLHLPPFFLLSMVKNVGTKVRLELQISHLLLGVTSENRTPRGYLKFRQECYPTPQASLENANFLEAVYYSIVTGFRARVGEDNTLKMRRNI